MRDDKSFKQACHAATAALWESRDEDMTLEYTDGDQLNHMHKVNPLFQLVLRLNFTAALAITLHTSSCT